MKPGLTKAALSEPRRRLVELMQSINFGRIEDLIVVGGDPVLDPLPRMVQEIKFGGDNGPRPELDANNFLLKAQVIELFQHLDQLGDGTIEAIEVKHGLPFRMILAKDAC
jgi:hypothetical protein